MVFKFLMKKKERNRLRFFTYSVYYTLIVIVCAFIIFVGFNAIISGGTKQSFLFNNKRPTIVITGSMEPTIEVNSIVMLEPVSFNDLEEGDIIRYDSGMGYSVMHRIIHKTVSYVVTKGDNNAVADTLPVMPQQVTGRVVSIHNNTSKLITFLFGKFSYEDMGGSVLRACAGMIGIGLFIAVSICMFILIFEMITTTFFFKKYKSDLVNSSSYWLDFIKNREEENKIVEEYLKEFESANTVKKIILAYKFRRWYNGLVNIEKEVKKADRRLRSLEKWL